MFRWLPLMLPTKSWPCPSICCRASDELGRLRRSGEDGEMELELGLRLTISAAVTTCTALMDVGASSSSTGLRQHVTLHFAVHQRRVISLTASPTQTQVISSAGPEADADCRGRDTCSWSMVSFENNIKLSFANRIALLRLRRRHVRFRQLINSPKKVGDNAITMDVPKCVCVEVPMNIRATGYALGQSVRHCSLHDQRSEYS